ncbi:MAG: MBL fold metallo-hydrolase [Clostridia bacterium]|nr:MBL fold metallo-hydrolase [Clostridia bacterium]
MTKFYLLPDSTYSQMFGCVIKTPKKTIVIDGGSTGDAPQLTAFLRERCNSHVDAWFFTHPHHDHVGSFWKIQSEAPDITFDRVYLHFPDLPALLRCGTRWKEEGDMWEFFHEAVYVRHDPRYTMVERGDTIVIDGVTVSVKRTYNPEILCDFVNNTSTVYHVQGPKASVLILGDLGEAAGEETMKLCTAEELSADYTQMAHHGQNGANRAFYEYVRPKRCIWPTPAWLWNNDRGEGFDTGPWKTVRTREWMEALGVTEHIVEKDGLAEFEI